MPGIKMVIGTTTYEVDNLTLGEHRAAKRIYGCADMSDLMVGDPDAVAAFIFIAMRRLDAVTPDGVLVERIDGLDLSEVEISGDEDEPEPEPEDPTPAVEDGAADTEKPKPAPKRKKGSAG